MLWTARVAARISATGHVALGSALRLEIIEPGTREAGFASMVVDAYLKAQGPTRTADGQARVTG